MNEKFPTHPKWVKSAERPRQRLRKEPPEPMEHWEEGQKCLKIRMRRGLFAIIDECDKDLCHYNWNPRPNKKTTYAQRAARINGKYTTVQMHRQILMIEDSSIGVDHKNSNGLDNRRTNLRIANQHFNLANQRTRTHSSIFKGVTKKGIKWGAQIKCHGKVSWLGTFSIQEEAARAYDRAAIEIFGEFSRVNFPLVSKPKIT